MRVPRLRRLQGKEKSWQEEPGESEEQWWRRRGGGGEDRNLDDPAQFFQESSSRYSQFEKSEFKIHFSSLFFMCNFHFFIVVIFTSQLISLSIEVCIPPEEVAIATKACGINIINVRLFVCL